jgi:phage virion morphogenesis protein
MAGASLHIDIAVNDTDIQSRLQQLKARMGDLKPAFRDIGEHLLNSTRARFQSQTAPDGTPWAALSPRTLKYKKVNKDKILTLHGRLRGTLNVQVTANSLRVGTPLIYGATHQFGDPRRHIPARPFLGLSSTDKQDVVAILNEWISGAFD